jgi:hypothetical protein
MADVDPLGFADDGHSQLAAVTQRAVFSIMGLLESGDTSDADGPLKPVLNTE